MLNKILIILLVACVVCINSASAVSSQKSFSSPDQAVNAFIKAVKENNNNEILAIFGSDANDLINSGDEVADRQRRQLFANAFEQQHKIETDGDKHVLIVGKNDWPFPIPIIEQNGKYIFDTASGKEEIINRRIGRNELNTIQSLLAVVDAQREYAMQDHDGDGVRKYAQKFLSDPGKKNGLYWETKNGEKPSPLGPLIAKAKSEGYTRESSDGPQPYYGYFYEILTAQGAKAQGGTIDYIVNGEMIGGFAVIAYPADYGNSGIMTFIVNHDGDVYQKDLGEDTEQKARNIKIFDPDNTWKKAQ